LVDVLAQYEVALKVGSWVALWVILMAYTLENVTELSEVGEMDANLEI